MRCFVSVDLQCPGELEAVVGPPPEHLHLTLRFLGDVAEELRGAIVAALADAAGRSRPFELGLEGIGAFPSPRNPRVVWVGVGAGRTECLALAADLERALGPLAASGDARPFEPHATLRRIRGGRDRAWAERVLGEGHGRAFGVQPIRGIVAYASALTRDGAVHTAFHRSPLGPAAAPPAAPAPPSAGGADPGSA
jgi:RNA 2',3'-cyclic 3'-phosphodiesterase